MTLKRLTLSCASIAIFAFSVSARNIVFPPIAGVNGLIGSDTQAALSSDNAPLHIGLKFQGLTTFANLPYVFCLSEEQNIESYDIAFLGAPFDTGVTGRPGARFGPRGIRQGSHRMSPEAGYNIYAGSNAFLDWAKIVDCGDVPLTVLDNTYALKQLDRAHKVVSGRTANSTEKSSVPRIITLGGDHTTTLSALRSTFDNWDKVSVIHFDSHLDTWRPDVLGGGISDYAGVNHGTFLHIAHEEGLIHNNSVHAGVRAPLFSRRDLKNDVRCGFDIITAREIDRIGVHGIIERLKSRVEGSKVYITVDIDVLDPAYAPATGTAEVGGWSTRELLSILDGLEGLDIIGADVVEVSPAYDNAGETTVLAAAEVAHSLMTLMVQKPVKAST
ncbi:arginase, variant [Xylona heveae TC161]|uniref:Arginase, variant n=1 Tax=Xylona heveae (strain CBS 132557 / TC161) TaxID=1328760 RepID=A0A165JN92_XYLHT|nr:arginase, variant [Xylona heveae TC161]KZF26444.1 arginase, variant [Xylona heveae TC161]